MSSFWQFFNSRMSICPEGQLVTPWYICVSLEQLPGVGLWADERPEVYRRPADQHHVLQDEGL